MQADPSGEASSLYDLSYTSIDGTEESMSKYKGHVLIVVNVASKCGYTCVNYEQLTELYTKYGESEGLRILACPCNQFMGQEPLGEKEIKEFAATYNVQYDMSSKLDVNGANTHPVWAFLKKNQGGFLGDFVKWNFTKFLVDKHGNVVKRYAPTTNPRVWKCKFCTNILATYILNWNWNLISICTRIIVLRLYFLFQDLEKDLLTLFKDGKL